MKQEKMIMKSIRPRTPLAWSTAIEKSLTDSYNLPALPFLYVVTFENNSGNLLRLSRRLQWEYIMVTLHKRFWFKALFLWYFGSTIYASEGFCVWECNRICLLNKPLILLRVSLFSLMNWLLRAYERKFLGVLTNWFKRDVLKETWLHYINCII